MTAAVASRRKRGAGAFLEEDPLAALPQLLAKRGRCSPSYAAADVADLGVSLEFDPLDALQLIFPGANPEVWRRISLPVFFYFFRWITPTRT
jgi:hypothetical protein